MDTLVQALFGYCQDGMITKICWTESERAGYSTIVIKIAFKLKGRQETSNVGSAVEGIFLIMYVWDNRVMVHGFYILILVSPL